MQLRCTSSTHMESSVQMYRWHDVRHRLCRSGTGNNLLAPLVKTSFNVSAHSNYYCHRARLLDILALLNSCVLRETPKAPACSGLVGFHAQDTLLCTNSRRPSHTGWWTMKPLISTRVLRHSHFTIGGDSPHHMTLVSRDGLELKVGTRAGWYSRHKN